MENVNLCGWQVLETQPFLPFGPSLSLLENVTSFPNYTLPN